MKRRLFKLAIFLLLGAVVNVAVAWSIAWWGDSLGSFTPHDPVSQDDRKWWMVHRPSEAVGEPAVSFDASVFGMAELEMQNIELYGTYRRNSIEGPIFQSVRRRIGIPLPTVEYSYWTREVPRPSPFNKQTFQVDQSIWEHIFPTPSQSIIHYHSQGVLAFENNRPNNKSGARGLPYKVLALGFVVNSLAYALVCYLVFCVIGSIIGWMRANIGAARRYAGLCPKCRYNLRGDFSAGCPECGWGREVEA